LEFEDWCLRLEFVYRCLGSGVWGSGFEVGVRVSVFGERIVRVEWKRGLSTSEPRERPLESLFAPHMAKNPKPGCTA